LGSADGAGQKQKLCEQACAILPSTAPHLFVAVNGQGCFFAYEPSNED
jgi:hypothetical protein